MKIVTLTPGTGSFHCGSCIRDNSLVMAMREQGHDVLMVPLYLPFVADAHDTSDGVPVFLGGVNAYLQQKSKLFRITPRWMDRMFDNNRLLRKVSQNASMTSARDLGEITVSTLKGVAGFQKKEIDRLNDFLKNQEKPDVVIISNMLLTGLAESLKKSLNCKIVVTMQGEDTFLDSLLTPWREDSWELIRNNSEHVDQFISVSKYHADLMNKRLKLPDEKVVVIHNGLDFSGYKKTSYPSSPPILGMLSRLIPGKGVDLLSDAYIHIRKNNLIPGLKLKLAGSKTKGENSFIKSVEDKFSKAGIRDDVEISFNLTPEEKIDYLASLTVFSVPAEYGESFGLYVIEAAAAGLPSIQPDSAAFPEILSVLDSGLLYKTGDMVDLATKIVDCFNDLENQKMRCDKAIAVVNENFTDRAMAKKVIESIESLF